MSAAAPWTGHIRKCQDLRRGVFNQRKSKGSLCRTTAARCLALFRSARSYEGTPRTKFAGGKKAKLKQIKALVVQDNVPFGHIGCEQMTTFESIKTSRGRPASPGSCATGLMFTVECNGHYLANAGPVRISKIERNRRVTRKMGPPASGAAHLPTLEIRNRSIGGVPPVVSRTTCRLSWSTMCRQTRYRPRPCP